jgi:hypothetical protein
VNMLNKQSWTADNGWSSMGAGEGTTSEGTGSACYGTVQEYLANGRIIVEPSSLGTVI